MGEGKGIMTVSAAGGLPERDDRARPEGWFYVGMAVAAGLTAAVGFAPALVDSASRKAPLTIAVAVHGGVFATWLLLFVAQTTLVGRGKIRLHQRLGYAAVALAVLMVISGYHTTIEMGRRGFDLSGDLHAASDPLFQMVFPLGDLVAFGVLVSVALVYRRRPAVHKRLMLLAMVGGLMPAALAHISGHFQVVWRIGAPFIVISLAVFLFAGAVHDRISRGKIHPVSLWVALGLFIWANVRAVIIGPSAAWHDFARWLIG